MDSPGCPKVHEWCTSPFASELNRPFLPGLEGSLDGNLTCSLTEESLEAYERVPSYQSAPCRNEIRSGKIRISILLPFLTLACPSLGQLIFMVFWHSSFNVKKGKLKAFLKVVLWQNLALCHLSTRCEAQWPPYLGVTRQYKTLKCRRDSLYWEESEAEPETESFWPYCSKKSKRRKIRCIIKYLSLRLRCRQWRQRRGRHL